MKILVTGGGGFLGTAICKLLLKKEYEVVNFSRNVYPHLTSLGVKTLKGDLSNPDSLREAMRDIDAIFHVAAIAGVWGKYDTYYQTNTIGSQNIVTIAKQLGIKFLIYTSTPSVVFGKEDINNGDESLSYPEKYLTHYAYTKHLAEKFILNSCDDNFFAVAIRPHLIWGPNDPHILPRLIEKAKVGKLKRVGEGTNLVDIIYVDNAAMAHVQAFEKLITDQSISANAYFIGQEAPVSLWDFIDKLITLSGEEPIESSISFKKAYFVGSLLEKVFSILGINKPEPPMTRFIATQLAKSHYFSHEKAKKDFGYTPVISIEEGLELTFAKRRENLHLTNLK
jgi:nucleoside-diphosphate-sugar epimerase